VDYAADALNKFNGAEPLLMAVGAVSERLKHELSSLAWTLGPWVKIPLWPWMFSVCVVCVRVHVEAL
jgi:hypothetical protein